MPIRNITYRGKEYKYRNVNSLARKLNVTVDRATQLINNQNLEKIFVSADGELIKFNLTNNPLFLQEFGIRRLSNKKLSNPVYNIKRHKIVNEVENTRVKIYCTVRFTFQVSIEEVTRTRRFNIEDTNIDENEIRGRVLAKVEEYVSTIDNAVLDSIRVDFDNMIITNSRAQEFQLIDMKLRDAVPLELFYENVDTTKYKDCVRDYLKNKYKKISSKTIDKLGDENGVSTTEIKEFCKKYNITLIAFNINGEVEAKHIPQKRNKSYGSLIYIAHNNHLYPLKNKFLHSMKSNKNVIVNNATEKLVEFLYDGKEPHNIQTFTNLLIYDEPTDIIASFQIKDTTYIQNKEYNKCYDILKKFGAEEGIHPRISLKNIGSIIEKLYKCNIDGSVDSFFPQSEKFIKGGFNYNSIRESYEDVVTIDKNKCYSYCLDSLPFLISLDYRQSKIIDHNKYLSYKDITRHHLYIIKPKQSSILIPDTNAYSGEHLIFCLQQGLKLYCLEEITTQKHENYLSQFVKDIYRNVEDPDDAKFIVNVFIGKLETSEERRFFKATRLCNKDEAKTVTAHKTKLKDTDYYIVEEEETSYNIRNRKPISIQIKDYSRVVLYNKMLELNIKQKDIIKIKTDSISFVDKKKIIRRINLNTHYTGWKQEIFEEPKTENKSIINNENLSFKLDKKIYDDQETHYYNCYAGVGKTYHIINKLIPKLKDYIVLTPSHSTIQEYRTNKYNCDVIQKYEYSNKLPDEKNIIIDECFLCSKTAHDIIYKCILSGKNVYIFGDDKQLLPVRENNQFDNKYYYNAFFRKHKQLKTNRRNDFTIDYYDKLIKGTYNNYNQVKKYHEPDYKKVEKIICYTNETRKKYNNLMLEHLGFKDMYQVGVKVICKSNKLRDKNIFNNFEFTISKKTYDKETEKYIYTLDDETDITHIQLTNFFEPAYAVTSYGVQGKSIKNYHYAKEDKRFLKDNNRLSYTIISRIKT